jgi:hypothetical protein
VERDYVRRNALENRLTSTRALKGHFDPCAADWLRKDKHLCCSHIGDVVDRHQSRATRAALHEQRDGTGRRLEVEGVRCLYFEGFSYDLAISEAFAISLIRQSAVADPNPLLRCLHGVLLSEVAE